jgi:hypothetical protein
MGDARWAQSRAADDVQAVVTAVAGHRLRPSKGSAGSHRARAEIVSGIVKGVSVP